MAYVRDISHGVGSLDAEDRDSALVREARGRIVFKNAIVSLQRMTPQQLEAFRRELLWAVNTLPPAQRRQVETIANAFARSDQRLVPGLGNPAAAAATAGQAVHWSTTLANVAGVVASVATIGFGVANFIEQRKVNESQRAAQERAQAAQEKELAASLAEKKQALEQSKKAFDQQQEMKRLEASGMMITADGQVVPKPKSGSLATAGSIAAAAVGAFLITQ